MKKQIEKIEWIPSDWQKPDDEITVLLFSKEDGVICGYWASEHGCWVDCTGSEMGDVEYFAIANGPEQ